MAAAVTDQKSTGGKEKEEVQEANLEVKLDVAEDSAETLDALPHAEPSTAQRHINKGTFG
ncbi:hypothetical protein TIFTF001_033837 [Ficus carica]|uniref:Uncharacterized protein n=1 Tax=Ficus carica TaxID=3494 RepID=A0AA88E009_FICCA|nr:hypothetical protein TIFTF001_033837 [Ficus carica]